MKTLLSKLMPNRSAASGAESNQKVTPDLSRVIKLDEASVDRAPAGEPVSDMADRAEDAMSSLSEKFEAWMEADLERLVTAWNDARHSDATIDSQQILAVAAHDLHGVAGSYGYPSISRLCGSLCRLLYTPEGHDDVGLINLHVEACRAVFAGKITADKDDPITDSVCGALEQKVANYAAG